MGYFSKANILFPLIIGIVSGQYPLEEPGGNVGGPLSQMSEAVNKIDNGSSGSNNGQGARHIH